MRNPFWRFRIRPIVGINEPLSFILAILSIGIYYIAYDLLTGPNPVFAVLIPILAATLVIVPHELAHRAAGRRMGCFARFALDERGFLITTFLNLVFATMSASGILFGAVFFSGYTLISCIFGRSRSNDGLIALAGPLTNMALGVLTSMLIYFFHPSDVPKMILQETANLSVWVAFFNLLPFGPLDGRKVMEWNSAVWAVAFVVSLALWFVVGRMVS